MYMMPAGNRTVLVGDLSLARALLLPDAAADGTQAELCASGGGADFREATQQQFDSVATQCAALGYRVVRIPVVPARDGKTYLTYLNVLIDGRDGRRVVYMPVYDQVPKLNHAASSVWRGLGYEVRSVNCSSVYTHFGSLGCLVNVLRRS